MATEVYEVILSGNLAGQFVQTVQHVKVNRSAITTQFQCAVELNHELMENGTWLSPFLDCVPSDYEATSSRIRCVNPTGGPTAISLKNALVAFAGTRAGEISSAQANPCAIFIGTTSPAKTGRLFFPGVSEDDIDEMALDATLVTNMQTFINALIVGGTISGTGDTWVGCIARRAAGPPHNVTSGDTIDAGYVSPLIGTQRRRLHPV